MESNKKKRAAIAAAIALLLAVGVWAFWGESVDPAVAALESQRSVMFSGDATDEQRAAFRQQVDQLTEAQRRQFFDRSRPDMQRRMAERMNELFALPPEQLRQEARQRAADIVAGRAEREAGGDDGRRGGPPGGRGGRTEAERDARAKQRLDFVDPSTRAQFSEFRSMVNEELKSRGHDELTGRDMRRIFGRPPRG